MDNTRTIEALKKVGCFAENATCTHKAQHGQKGEPGQPTKTRIYCSAFFDREGNPRPMYDIAQAATIHPEIKAVYDNEIKAALGGTAALSELEQLEAEKAAAIKDREDKIRGAADLARKEKLKAEIQALRDEPAPFPYAARSEPDPRTSGREPGAPAPIAYR